MPDAGAQIRPASPADAAAIVRLMAPYVAEGLLLPRPAEDIPSRDFLVARQDGEVRGCVALRDFGDGLHEVRSLAVHPESGGSGIGSLLVNMAVRLAAERGCRRLFTLTRRPRLFQRQGFRRVPMSLFPEKVWSDCSVCPRRDCCDEFALLLDLPHGGSSSVTH